MNQKSGGAEKQRDGDTEPMRSKKTKAQRFLAKPLVRRRTVPERAPNRRCVSTASTSTGKTAR